MCDVIDIREMLLARIYAEYQEEQDLIASGIEPVIYRYETEVIAFRAKNKGPD